MQQIVSIAMPAEMAALLSERAGKQRRSEFVRALVASALAEPAGNSQ